MFFSRNNWNCIPEKTKEDIQSLLSEDEFVQLTKMCRKYKVFPQMKNAVKDPLGMPIIPISLRLMFFLTNVGNAVCSNNLDNKEIVEESTIFMKTALAIKPDHFPALFDLTYSYAVMGKKEEAKSQALKALSAMENDDCQEHNKELRNILLKISKGNIDIIYQ